ncbi:MAG TPA: insulinase family protein [Gemmatimonadaceae bacterium]|nr:insulinase family protein [Gemmatimonadaceae bacterium]
MRLHSAFFGACLVISAPFASLRGQAVPVDTHVQVGTLANGLRYYIRENRRPVGRAELRLAINAGSVLEDDDQRGLAHFVEHMAFNGTRNFPKQDLVNFLERIGMRFGPDVNAYTSFDETVYMITVPTDSIALLRQGLRILGDWAQGVTFDSTEVEKERGVVVEEWRGGRGAGMRLLMQTLPTTLKGSKYAERLPIGTKESLEGFNHASLRRFYHDWYRPDLTAIVAVGDFDKAQVEAWIKEQFSRIPRSARPRPRPAVTVPDHRETLVAIATDPEETNSSVSVVYKLQPITRGTEAVERQIMIERLYSAILNRRFNEAVQRPNPPFIGAGSGRGELVRAKGAYFLNAAPRDDAVATALEAMLTEAERISRYGATAPELERIKADMLRSYERAYAERDKSESDNYASEYVRAFLEGEPIPGIAWEYAFAQRIIPTITLAEINALPRRLMGAENRVVTVTAPDRTAVPLPTADRLRAILNAAESQTIAAYVDSASTDPLLKAVPAAAAIVRQDSIRGLGVTDWTLGNGVRVLLKPTDFKADQVILSAFSPGGASLAPDSIYLSAAFASSLATLGGVGTFSAVNLQKQLAGKAVGVSPSIAGYEEGFSGSASPKDLETLFQLVYLYATAPRPDSLAFASAVQRLKSMLANQGADPDAVFSDTVQVTMSQGHPRRRPLSAARVDELRLETAIRFYRERFADASDFTFVIVGAFTLDSIRPLVQRYLGGLPATGRRESWKDEGIRPPSGVVRRVVRKGLEPKANTLLMFTGPIDYSRENLRTMGALGDVLEIRLRERLREDLGGTYGVNAGGSVSNRPTAAYNFTVNFGSSPDRADELTRVVFEEIEALKRSGPSATDVDKVKEQLRREYETNQRRNEYWVGTIAGSLSAGLDPRDVLGYEAFVAGLTAPRLQSLARQVFNTGNYAHFTLLPETPTP